MTRMFRETSLATGPDPVRCLSGSGFSFGYRQDGVSVYRPSDLLT